MSFTKYYTLHRAKYVSYFSIYKDKLIILPISFDTKNNKFFVEIDDYTIRYDLKNFSHIIKSWNAKILY